LRRDFVDESVSIPRRELGDFSPVFIPALERPYFTLRYLDMPGGWLERILADLAQDRFAEGLGLTKQNGFEVKVAMIGTAILDAWREAQAVRFRCFALTLGGGNSAKVLIGGVPLRLESATPIPILSIGGNRERMLALPTFLARGLFSLAFGLGAGWTLQRLVLGFNSIKERL
jgi:hypothetical protein